MDFLKYTQEVTALGEAGSFSMAPILRAVASDFLSLKAPNIKADKLRVALTVTESEAGSNFFKISTSVSNQKLNGRKVYISGADVADKLFVVARKDDGFCVLWLDPKLPGISITPMKVWGEVDLRPCEVVFKGVSVSIESLIAEGKSTGVDLLKSFNVERILIAHQLVGVSRFCIRIACEEAKKRTVFGQTPIGSYQGVQYPIAEAKIREAR